MSGARPDRQLGRGPGVVDPARPRADAGWLFGLFNTLFAVSLILHQLWWNGFEVRTAHALVVLAAGWVLQAPGSVGRFAAMIAAEVVAVSLDMPFAGSHTLLVLIFGGCALVHLGWTALRARSVPTPESVFNDLAPFLRAALIVVYATAALAKMNTSFLDPAISCASSMSRQLAWFDPSLLDGSWRIEPAIWATIAVEVALPVLLAARRTRIVGLVLGGGFHTVLALAGNVPFSALAFAFYVAFLPLDTPERVHARWQGRCVGSSRSQPARPVRRPAAVGRVLALIVFVGAWLGGAALSVTHPALTAGLVAEGTRLVVVLIALGAGGVLLASRRGAPEPPRFQRRSLGVGHPVLLAGVLLLVVNGLSPYLGLKTDSSFEMFSNLRTEPGAWNHLLIPESARLFGYQNQLVRVVASNDPALLARGAGGTRLVRFELDRYLRSHPNSVVTYTTGPGSPPHTEGPLPPGQTPLERIAVFRDVPPPGRPRC